jgi:hypothetical protein
LAISKQVTGLYVNASTVTFPYGWAIAPSSLPPTSLQDFKFFVNGQYVEYTSIVSFTDYGSYSTLVIDQIALGYMLEANDVIVGIGKFN